MSKRSGVRRVLGALGAVVSILVTFAAAAVVAVVTHLDAPVTRRLVVTQVNAVLARSLAGDVRVERLGRLGLDGVGGVSVRARDPEGETVLVADGVAVGVDALGAARSALFDEGPIVVYMRYAHIDHVDANLDDSESGDLRIATALRSKHPREDAAERSARGVRVEAPDLRLAHAWVHGAPSSGVRVDVEISDLAAHAHVTPELTRAELSRVDVLTRAMPRGLDLHGTIAGRARLPSDDRGGKTVEVTFSGDVGGIPTSAEAWMDGDRIDAWLDARDATGRRARAIVHETALREPVSLRAEVHGTLSHLGADAKLVVGDATVAATAAVEHGESTRVKGHLTARRVDLAALFDGAPASELGLDARADITLGRDGARGEMALSTLPGRVEEQRLPRVDAHARLVGRTATLRARIREPSMPTDLSIDVAPRSDGREGRVISVAVRSSVPDLGRVPRPFVIRGGSAAVAASARVTLPDERLDASAAVSLSRIEHDRVTIGSAAARACATGTLDRPVIDVDVRAKRLLTGTFPVASLGARARVGLHRGAIELERPHVTAVLSGHAPVSANAERVRVRGSAVRVEGAEVLGLGEPIHLDASRDSREVRAEIDAPLVDLRRVASLVGRGQDVRRGTLGVRGEARLRSGELDADLHADLRGLDVRRIEDANAVVDFSADGRAIALDAHGSLDGAGSFVLRTEDLVVGGKVTDPEAWKAASGCLHLAGRIDLAKIASLAPPRALPFTDLRGTLVVEGRLERTDSDVPPEVRLHARTNGLLVTGPAREQPPPMDGVVVTYPPKWRSTDLDVGLDVRNDGPSGLTSLALRTTDRHGPLVAIDVKTILPYADIVAHPSSLRERVLRAPMSAKIVAPRRRVDQLPAILGVKDVRGEVGGHIDASGTLLDPSVHVDARGWQIRAPAMPPGMKTDAELAIDYDGDTATVAMKMSDGGRELLDARSEIDARVRDVFARPTAPIPWKASARARLASFPLESVPALADRQIKGNVTGVLSLEGLHEDARLDARVDVSNLSVGSAKYSAGTVFAHAAGGKLAAHVSLEQERGFFDARAAAGLAWGRELVPSIDLDAPASARLVAKSFRAAALQPFVQSVMPAFDGRIEADASAELSPGLRSAKMQGRVEFHDGTVQIAALGEELRQVRAVATLSPDGTVKIEGVRARGINGELFADGIARLEGLRVVEAAASVRIPERRALDVTLGGQPMGQISGVVNVRTAPDLAESERYGFMVDVPRLTVALPRVTKRGLQPLERKEDVRVGVYHDARTFVELPLDRRSAMLPEEKNEADRAPIEVRFHLGNVLVTRGNQVRVRVTGDPRLVVGADTKVYGRIQTTGGFIDVQGKKFEVEKGTITFQGEHPPNPVVVATAAWTAADDTRVYADFVGPMKTGNVTFRSEPPRPKNEILALVLFGTTSGANPAPPPPGRQPDGTTKAAVGLGGGLAAQGLTEALDDLAGIQATARVDTTRASNPRPEVEFQLSPKVTISFAHVIGTPPVTEPDKNLATIDYRFHRNWSVETTVGDRGRATVDAVWQKRY